MLVEGRILAENHDGLAKNTSARQLEPQIQLFDTMQTLFVQTFFN
jgi:hypothetical protein